MKDNSRFFSNEMSNVESFDNMGGEFNFTQDLNADGQPTVEADPFIITLHNSTGSDIIDVAFIRPSESLRAGVFNNGVWGTTGGVIKGLVVTYGYAGTTYEDFLNDLMVSPVTIEKTYIYAATQIQMLTSIQRTVKNTVGGFGGETLTPVIDPYQNQQLVAILKKEFTLDRFTTLTLASLAHGETVRYSFYPKNKLNATAQLGGASAVKTFNTAKISIANL